MTITMIMTMTMTVTLNMMTMTMTMTTTMTLTMTMTCFRHKRDLERKTERAVHYRLLYSKKSTTSLPQRQHLVIKYAPTL